MLRHWYSGTMVQLHARDMSEGRSHGLGLRSAALDSKSTPWALAAPALALGTCCTQERAADMDDFHDHRPTFNANAVSIHVVSIENQPDARGRHVPSLIALLSHFLPRTALRSISELSR